MCGRFLLCLDTSYTCQVPRHESGKIGLLSSNKGRGKMIGGMVVDAGVMMTGGTGRAQARKAEQQIEACSRAGVGLE